MGVRSDKIVFTNGSGARLAARLELPEGEPSAYAIFAHCFTCSMNIAAATRISRALCARGIGVLRFDFTGLGNSEGDFANTNFSSNVDDLLSAAAYLAENLAPPRILVGHSLGGAAVLAAAPKLPEIAAVATIGAPADPAHVKNLLRGDLEEIEAEGSAEVNIGGRGFLIKRQFLEDLSGQKMEVHLRGLDAALMVFHSPLDSIVSIDEAARIYMGARHPKSFISLDGADHLLTRAADAVWVADLLAVWAERYLGE